MQKSGVISIILTLMVIGALLIAGPARAIDITLSTLYVDGTAVSGNVTIGNVITFNATINISSGENIPIQNVSILINNSVECVFTINGTLLSTNYLCRGFTVALNTSNHAYENASGFGYGFGIGENGTTTANTSFGQGYGYTASTNPLLRYIIEWDTDDFSADDYEIIFYATARNGATYFKYASESPASVTLAAPAATSNGPSTSRTSKIIVKPESLSYIYTVLSKGVREISIAPKKIPVFGLILNVLSESTNGEIKFMEVTTPIKAFEGAIYKYFQIDVSNIKLSSARIKFKIDKTWVADQKKGEIYLARYHNGVWEKLETNKLSEDAEYAYYEALTPGFSQFAIVAATEELPSTTPPEPSEIGITPEEETVTAPVMEDITEDQVMEEVPPPSTGGWIWALITVVIVVVLVVLWNTKRKEK